MVFLVCITLCGFVPHAFVMRRLRSSRASAWGLRLLIAIHYKRRPFPQHRNPRPGPEWSDVSSTSAQHHISNGKRSAGLQTCSWHRRTERRLLRWTSALMLDRYLVISPTIPLRLRNSLDIEIRAPQFNQPQYNLFFPIFSAHR